MCSLERVLIYADSARVGVCPVSQPQCVRDHGHVQPDFLANPKRSDVLSAALLFFVFFFPLTFVLKSYLSLEKLMNLQRSVCTNLIMDCFWFILRHPLYLKELLIPTFEIEYVKGGGWWVLNVHKIFLLLQLYLEIKRLFKSFAFLPACWKSQRQNSYWNWKD